MIERNRKKLETEQEIAQSVAAGDAKAIKELYDRTVGYMTSVATRYLGESDYVSDVLQDAYIYIISALFSGCNQTLAAARVLLLELKLCKKATWGQKNHQND